MTHRQSRRTQRGFMAGPPLFSSGSSIPAGNPAVANVLLLIHGDERPFLDVGPLKLMVANRSALATVSSSKCDLGGTTRALLVPPQTAFGLGTSPWMMSAKVTCGSDGARIFNTQVSGTTGFVFGVAGTTLYPYVKCNSTTYGLSGTPTPNLTLTSGVESEVMATYDGTTLRMFVDGALSWSHTATVTVTDSSNRLIIGNESGLTTGTSAQKLREMILVSGEAVRTAAYTPLTRWYDTGTVLEAAAQPTYSNVKLNIHGSSLSSGSTSITDTSTAARTVTVNGNAQGNTTYYRIGTSSISFDGTGDYLTVPQSSDFTFAGDFSVEMQCYMTGTTQRAMISCYQNSTTGWSVQSNISTAGRMFINLTGDGGEIDTGASIDVLARNAWKHVVVARKDSYLALAIEGEFIALVNDTQTATCSIALAIGRLGNTSGVDMLGYLQEIRVIKGEAPYFRSFIVPTSAHPDS